MVGDLPVGTGLPAVVVDPSSSEWVVEVRVDGSDWSDRHAFNVLPVVARWFLGVRRLSTTPVSDDKAAGTATPAICTEITVAEGIWCRG